MREGIKKADSQELISAICLNIKVLQFITQAVKAFQYWFKSTVKVLDYDNIPVGLQEIRFFESIVI